MDSGKTRIVVLGGGPAALSAVWEITESPEWQDRFEIDVYTLGWRLGGKCASGRDKETGKSYEHGLHLLCGFYHNTFGQLIEIYKDWNTETADYPLNFEDTFIKKKDFSLMQKDPLRWREVKVAFQDNGKSPGEDPPTTTILEILTNLARWLGVEFAAPQALRARYSSSNLEEPKENQDFDDAEEEYFKEISQVLEKAVNQLDQVSRENPDEALMNQVIYDLDGLNLDVRRRAWPIQNADSSGHHKLRKNTEYQSKFAQENFKPPLNPPQSWF